MEIILPWERDDIEVLHSDDTSSDADDGGTPPAAMFASLARSLDTEGRIAQLADGVEALARATDRAPEDILDEIAVRLEGRADAESE